MSPLRASARAPQRVCALPSERAPRAIKHGYPDYPIKAINAGHIDDLVRASSLDYLASVSVDQLASQPPEARDHWIRHVIDVVVLTTKYSSSDWTH